MRILDRYIRSSVIWATCLVVLVLLGIESFIEFIAELPSMGVAHYDVFAVFSYVSLQMPSDLYQLFPIAGFIGSLIGLGRLASTSELIIMRAAGVSVARIAWSVVKAALLMLIFITVIGEWWAPTLQYQAVQLKEKKMHRKLNPWSTEALWLHQGNIFAYIGKVSSGAVVDDVARFDFDSQGRLTSSTTAKKAILQNGMWQLKQVAMTKFTESQATVIHYDSFPLGFTFEPELLRQKNQLEPAQQTITQLWNNIRYRKQAGLLASELQSAFWSRLLQPLTTVVMICLGVPFIFGSLRSASMGARILLGIIVGFAFYMLNQFIGPIALVYQWPAWIAGALPMIVFLLIYALLITRTK
ncbi:MAG: LPS export ABC transporter permease LptG [Proteobacteria bacterium]|nr:LPS export ABC transporter permease LptG [Pseudomonadota bacterium]